MKTKKTKLMLDIQLSLKEKVLRDVKKRIIDTHMFRK